MLSVQPFLGMILQIDGKLEQVSCYGNRSNIDDDNVSEDGICEFLINNRSSGYERALITLDVLIALGFIRNRESFSYELLYKDISVVIDVNKDSYPKFIFYYKTPKGESIQCTYVDEIQSAFANDYGFPLELSI